MSDAPALAIQDFYPDDFSHCYGCGRLNPRGLHIKTRWDGEEAVAIFTPREEHTSVPGFVYGGLLASLIDCHAIGAASAAVERAVGRRIGEATAPRFVTGALKIDYLKPTPLGGALTLRALIREIGPRKVLVDVSLSEGGVETVRGEVVAVRMPDSMRQVDPSVTR
jgi:acyl-coenzyme A thioesterase PaaI-like protein